ncbi:MAG: endopeptidase La [Pseudomonadota bacterium]|nr:endopeptidase La [Pseudomonadota bacterium]
MANLDLEKKSPVVAVRELVVFPGTVVPLYVGRKGSLAAVNIALEGDGYLLCLTQRDAEKEDIVSKDLYRFGTTVKILQAVRMPDGNMKLLVEGIARAKVTKLEKDRKEGFFKATISEVLEKKIALETTETLIRVLQDKFADYLKQSEHITLDIISNISSITNISEYADLIAAHIPVKISDKQSVLETLDVEARVKKILMLLENELSWHDKEKEILEKVRAEINEDQQSYFIRKKMKAYEEELRKLGDDSISDAGSYEAKIEKLTLTDDVKQKLLNEAGKLKFMPDMSAESTVVRNYLDTMLALPWGKVDPINTDLVAAAEALEKNHYGLKKIKERVLESLAVSLRVKTVKAPILCLIGPPGVGKTSLGKSIAEAMGRPFVRVALGGVRDESEIRGHRRTYVGAMPGQIIRALTRSKAMNPLIMLDEVDKMGMDFRGDPASALLEVLDPEQNNKFVDHYIESEVDLSGVLFITTANTPDIPPALMDRMELIDLSGYTEEEKQHIAHEHLIQKCLDDNGLLKKELCFNQEAVTEIIRSYTREAGVRELERNLSKVCRKVVKEKYLAKRKSSAIKTIGKKDLQGYLDSAPYDLLDVGKKPKVGVVNGLAWTAAGGELLNIEALSLPGKGELIYTGSLGEVMQESIRAAHSVVRNASKKYKVKEDVFSERDFHIHVPEGATPKDGPSAGIGMATAMLSVATKQKVKNKIAMTGELTITGEVLAIGGLKEKILAAIRSGANEVIIPKSNKKDLKDFEKDIKGKIEVHLVSEISEVFKHAFTE